MHLDGPDRTGLPLLKGKDPESITPIRALKEHLSEIDA